MCLQLVSVQIQVHFKAYSALQAKFRPAGRHDTYKELLFLQFILSLVQGPVYQSGACTAEFCQSLMQHQKEDTKSTLLSRISDFEKPSMASQEQLNHTLLQLETCMLGRRRSLPRSTLTR